MNSVDFLWSLGTGFAPPHIVDVGANPIEGEAPYNRLLAAGYARLTGFEPQEAALAELMAAKSEAENYFPQALGDGAPAELKLFSHSGFASVFDIDQRTAALLGFQRGVRPAGSLRVETSRLDDLGSVAGIDYLKIDVQGSELSVISHGRGKLRHAVLVQAEVRFLPIYDGEPSFGDLERELSEQGFRFHDFAFLKRQPLRSRSSGALRRRAFRQVVDGDAFFVRDLTGIDGWSESQVWKLALLGEAVVKSPSLVIYCLDALEDRSQRFAGAAAQYIERLPEAMRH